MQLYIELRSLLEGSLYAAYLGDLAADVEMYQLEAVFHAFLLQHFERLEQFRTGESKLAGVATALFPFAASRRGQFDSDTQVGLDIQFFGGLGNDVDFVQFFHHDKDALAHLLCQQGQFDVALVFVAVADDERVALALHGDDRMQFGLASCLQSEVELAAVADDFFHHRLHLVHLDGIDDKVFTLKSVGIRCLFETTPCLFDTVVEDVRKSQQHGRCDVAQCQFVDHVMQVDLCVVFAWGDIHVTLRVDAEVGCSPSPHVVKLLRVFNSPFFHQGCFGFSSIFG